MSLIKNVMREGDKNQFEGLLRYFQKNAEELQQIAKDYGNDGAIVLKDIDGLSEPFNSVFITEEGLIAFPAPTEGYHYNQAEGSKVISTSFDFLKDIEFFTGTKDYQIDTDDSNGMLYASDTKDNDSLRPLHQSPIFVNMNGFSFDNLYVNPKEFVPSIETKLDEIKQQALGNDTIDSELSKQAPDISGPKLPESTPDVYKSLLQIKEEFNRDIDTLSKSIDEKWLTIEDDEDYKNSKEELKGYVNNARDYGNSSIDVMNSIEGAKVSGLYYDKDIISNEDRGLMDKVYKEAKEGFEEADKFQKGLTKAMEMPQKTPLIKYVAAEVITALAGTHSFKVYGAKYTNQKFNDELSRCAALQKKMDHLSQQYDSGLHSNIFTRPLYKAQFKVLSVALDSHLKTAEKYRQEAAQYGRKAFQRLDAVDSFLKNHGMSNDKTNSKLLNKEIDVAITQNIITIYKDEIALHSRLNVDIEDFARRMYKTGGYMSDPERVRAKFEKEVAIPLAKKIKEESSEAEVENEMDDQELE